MSYGDGTLLELFIDVEKRWDTMLDTADVTRQLLQSIIGFFSRKTSEEFATATIRNILKKNSSRPILFYKTSK